MKTVELGTQGLTVSAQGFGAMSMSGVYGASHDEADSIATLNHAVDLGITLFDTAESYGPFENERLLHRALGHRRDEIILATKFGLDFTDDGEPGPLDGRPEHIRRAVERSLRHLGTDVIDLYYMHRLDPDTPSRRPSAAWQNSSRPARCATSACLKCPPRRSGAPTRCTR